MNWFAALLGMALAALVFAVITDLELTTCREASFYATVHLCAVKKP